MIPLERHSIDVGDGTLEVFVGGRDTPVVASTHPCGWLTGEETACEPDLSDQRIVWVNPRGLGNSSPVRLQRELRWTQLVDDLESVRQASGTGRWVFHGVSSGGCVGLQYALRYPAALCGLIVAFSTASGDAFITDSQFDPTLRPTFARLPDGSWAGLAYRTDPDLTIQARANQDELGHAGASRPARGDSDANACGERRVRWGPSSPPRRGDPQGDFGLALSPSGIDR